MNPLTNNISYIKLSLLLILVFSLLSSKVPCQSGGQGNSRYKINCLLPDVVEAESEFTITFEIIKGGYVGPLKIDHKLPNGFRLVEDNIINAEISTDRQQFEIIWKALPPDDIFSFDITLSVANISQAVYPFHGMAHFYDFSIPYGESVTVTSETNTNVAGREGYIAPLSFGFEMPEEIIAGLEFTFVTTINKETNYTNSGKLTQKWPSRLVPMPTKIQNADLSISNNVVEISWDKLEVGTYFSIAYQVFAKENAAGFYTVLTNFLDSDGVKIVENVSVRVVNSPIQKPDARVPKKEKLHQLWCEHPTEVVQGKEFELSIFIQKGKNTQPGSLHLKLPPGCEIDVTGMEGFSYNQAFGELMISWDHMPSSPVVEVKSIVNTKEVTRAGYMILAEFFLDGKLMANSSSLILISDKEQLSVLKKQEKTLPVPNGIDTTEMFSKIDNLLKQWQESTKGLNQSETGKVEKNIVDFRVQILASKKMLPNLKRLLLSMNMDEPFNSYYDGEIYRYTVGKFNTRDDCVAYMKFVQNKGFADAFIVKYIDDGPAKGD